MGLGFRLGIGDRRQAGEAYFGPYSTSPAKLCPGFLIGMVRGLGLVSG